MDDIDITSDRLDREMENRLRARVNRPTLVPCGHCHWCDEDVGSGKVFCSSECRDDFDADAVRRARKGPV